jgi:hypothetical protein
MRCSLKSTLVISVSPGTAGFDPSRTFAHDGAGRIDDDTLAAGRAAQIVVVAENSRPSLPITSLGE